VACTHVDWVDAYLDDHPPASQRVTTPTFVIRVPRSREALKTRNLRLQGFRQDELVAATRLALS